MNLPVIPLILVIAVLAIYVFWKMMTPQKKKPGQRRFSIRNYKNSRTDNDPEETD